MKNTILILAVFLVCAGHSQGAVELIVNGGFEAGFTGWTTLNQSGGSGAWFLDAPGTTSPLSRFATAPNPIGQTTYAVTDQGGPGAHVLFQSFVVPLDATSITVSFQMFANDQDSGPIVNPAGIDYTASPNQHARVDILYGGAAPFSTFSADMVANLYLGVDPGADPNPYTSYSSNLVLAPGDTYILRFAEADNQLFFQLGVDNVSVMAELNMAVPEASAVAIWGLGAVVCITVGAARRRRVKRD